MYENKSHRNKKIALAAALAVAILALAGVGYATATHNFTGTTPSAEQAVDPDFVTVSLDTASYTTQTVDANKIHAIWNTSTAYTDSTVKTTYTFSTADVFKYQITVDATATEADVVLSGTTTAYTGADYTLKYLYSATSGDKTYAEVIAGENWGTSLTLGNITAGTSATVYLWVTLVPVDSPRVVPSADAPLATTANIPIITFTATGTA